MTPRTTHHLYPPFPPGLPTAALLSISLADLQNPRTEQAEASRLFAACRDLGFFYLDLFGSDLGERIVAQAEELQLLQQEFYALSHEEKDLYGRDKVDPFFSYRWAPCIDGVKDVWGRPGRREMYSLRVDDYKHIRPPLPKADIVKAADSLLTSFGRDCREVVDLLLFLLESQLKLPPGSLMDLHRNDQPSGDFISLQHRAAEAANDLTVKKGEHTDFGSITMLFNWLGGLQIRDQSVASDTRSPDERWVYVVPVPGSAVINLADSLCRLTAGILKTNIHRVAPAPGDQATLPRYSLVYFAHPNDNVPLVPIKGLETGDAVVADDGILATAAEWTDRRSLGDLRGVYTYGGGIELRENNDAVAVPSG